MGCYPVCNLSKVLQFRLLGLYTSANPKNRQALRGDLTAFFKNILSRVITSVCSKVSPVQAIPLLSKLKFDSSV